MIIAIDGPAASGKGTIGRRLAAALGLAFLDTGLLYRATTKRVLDQRISPFNLDAVVRTARDVRIEDVAGENLRSPEVSKVTPIIAGIPEVRTILGRLQREFAHKTSPTRSGVVLDGRDIGTVILPEADVKLFITANLHSRAQRRYKELRANGVKTSFQSVHRDLRLRDEQDVKRSASPLRPALDAVILDTTEMSIEEAFAQALDVVRMKTPLCGASKESPV
jgi:cytidylate kinase